MINVALLVTAVCSLLISLLTFIVLLIETITKKNKNRLALES